MAMARMRRACLASAVRAASARNCEILRSWRVISIADMMPAPRIIDVLHRVTFADGWESHRSQVLRQLVLLAERGIMVSYETVRRWVNHFGPMIAADLCKRRPKPYTTWHLDEVYLKIDGRMVYLWRAVDAEGEVLDVLVQS